MRDYKQGEVEGPALVWPTEEKTKGRYHCCLQLQNGREYEDGARLFSEVQSDRMGGDRHVLQQRSLSR